ncbi:hypothetical protein NG2371_07172 [Nocardia gamkensis]|nr:hypothetical protein [Nocardia gamkensis]
MRQQHLEPLTKPLFGTFNTAITHRNTMQHKTTRYYLTVPMGSAALPGRAGQGRADRGNEPGVGVAGDELDAREAAGNQVTEKRQPAGTVLAGGDLDAEDFAVALGVDAGRDQTVHVDHAPVLADFQHQGVGGDERVRALVERAAAEGFHLGIQVAGHHRHLRFRQAGNIEGLDEFLHPPGRYAQQVAGRHHAGEGPFGAFAAFEQPVRKVAARP